MAVISLCKGQQTLSEEVSERTHSRMLRLEKENQSLLRTIKELQAASVTSGCVLVVDQSTSSEVPQTSCPPNGFQQCSAQERMLNGDSKVAQNVIAFGDDLNFHTQESVELNDRGDSSNCLRSELEILENHLNRRRSSAGSSGGGLPSSNGSSPSCHHQGPLTRPSHNDKQKQRLEAKCRAMDTFNQHLQASLDTTGRFWRSADTVGGQEMMQGFAKVLFFCPPRLLQPVKSSGWRPRCRSWRLRTRACRPLWRSYASLCAAWSNWKQRSKAWSRRPARWSGRRDSWRRKTGGCASR